VVEKTRISVLVLQKHRVSLRMEFPIADRRFVFKDCLDLNALSAYTACMSNRPPFQYTIRGIPPSLDRLLRERAKRNGVSLNSETIMALKRAVGLLDEGPVFHDLDDLAGTWIEDPAFDKVMEEMDQIEPDLWR